MGLAVVAVLAMLLSAGAPALADHRQVARGFPHLLVPALRAESGFITAVGLVQAAADADVDGAHISTLLLSI